MERVRTSAERSYNKEPKTARGYKRRCSIISTRGEQRIRRRRQTRDMLELQEGTVQLGRKVQIYAHRTRSANITEAKRTTVRTDIWTRVLAISAINMDTS